LKREKARLKEWDLADCHPEESRSAPLLPWKSRYLTVLLCNDKYVTHVASIVGSGGGRRDEQTGDNTAERDEWSCRRGNRPLGNVARD
jgi:hypothetical protein